MVFHVMKKVSEFFNAAVVFVSYLQIQVLYLRCQVLTNDERRQAEIKWRYMVKKHRLVKMALKQQTMNKSKTMRKHLDRYAIVKRE